VEEVIIIAGPCVLEETWQAFDIAQELQKIAGHLDIEIIFKASFDKANRSSAHSYRGVGIKRGIEDLSLIKSSLGMRVTTDIHEPWHAEPIAEVCDMIQIPAFLCRQTDLLEAAAKTERIVNVKKGQFLAPEDMGNVVGKLKEFGCRDMYLTERGTFFGYGRLVNDMGGLLHMRTLAPVIFDATHSAQKPGGLGDRSGGNRELVEPLAKAAVAVGVDGLFFETHPDPDSSPSDGPNMVPLGEFEELLKRVLNL